MDIIIRISFFLLSLHAIGQRNPFTKGLVVDKNHYTEVSFEFIQEKIIIPVVIENKEYKFILDTGAPNVISKELKSIITSKYISSINVTDATIKKSKLDLVSIPLITIGGVSFRNCPTLTDNTVNNMIFDCFETDGIIGSNLFSKSILQIDLNRKLIILTDKVKQLNLDKTNSCKLDLVNKQGSPYVWVNFGNDKKVREHVLIDTGMKGFYDLTLSNFEVLKKNKVFKVRGSGVGSASISLFGAAEENKQYQILISEFKLNNTTFKNVITETTSDNNSRMGTAFLKYGIMTFNFKRKLFYFNSYNEEYKINSSTLGFKPTLINKKLVVGIVWDEGLKKEIASGDEIIKINNLDISTIPLCDFINGNNKITDKSEFKMTIRKKDLSIKTLHIKKSYFNNE